MKCHKLRIAWSVAWGIAAVLLVAIWVRSYWWTYITQKTEVAVSNGTVRFHQPVTIIPTSTASLVLRFYVVSVPTQCVEFIDSSGNGPTLPLWLLVAPSLIFAISPWLRWWSHRFSLRTLLIATTLVAVGLGLIVWLASK